MYFSNCLALECHLSRSFCLAVFCGFLFVVLLFSQWYCCRNTSLQWFITSKKHFSILNSLFVFFRTFPAARKTVCLTQIVFFSSLRKHPLSHLYIFIAYRIHLFRLKYSLEPDITMKSLQIQQIVREWAKTGYKKKKKCIQPIVCSGAVKKK